MIQIVTLSGASGAGKSTIVRAQLNWLSHAVMLVRSATTRPPQPSDLPGEYERLSNQEFEALERMQRFLWIRGLRGEKYGTRKEAINTFLQEKHKTGLMILTPDTIPVLKTYAPEIVFSIYIVSFYYRGLLAERMRKRGDSQERITLALKECEEWDAFALDNYQLFDCFVSNRAADLGLSVSSCVMQKIIALSSL